MAVPVAQYMQYGKPTYLHIFRKQISLQPTILCYIAQCLIYTNFIQEKTV